MVLAMKVAVAVLEKQLNTHTQEKIQISNTAESLKIGQ